MMRMSCPSFSDNCFRLAVGGRVFNGRLRLVRVGVLFVITVQYFIDNLEQGADQADQRI